MDAGRPRGKHHDRRGDRGGVSLRVLDADQLNHYVTYCSEMLSLTAKTSALCGEYSTDGVVLETISGIEALTTELCDKIWQKISLLPRP